MRIELQKISFAILKVSDSITPKGLDCLFQNESWLEF